MDITSTRKGADMTERRDDDEANQSGEYEDQKVGKQTVSNMSPSRGSPSEANITVTEEGSIIPKDSSELVRLAKQLLKGNGVPQWFKTEAQIVSAWNYLASLGLSPHPNLKNVAFINGTPCLFGDGPKALAEKTKEIEVCRVFVCDEQYQKISFENKNLTSAPFAGVCQIKRKGRDEQSYHFTVEQAKKAGLWDKRSTPWVTYPEIMLARRAQAQALKFEFSDALSGVFVAEYDFNEAPDIRDVTPEKSGAEELKEAWRDPSGTDKTA